MKIRFMRMIVFFDLPVTTGKEQKEYRLFRKYLIQNGFVMMQESVYSKLFLNNNSTKIMRAQLRKHIPKDGLVQVLEVTEKQFASIEYLVGSAQNKVIDNMNRVVVL